MNDASTVSATAMQRLSIYALIGIAGPAVITTRFIGEALRSGEFLEFDRAKSRYIDSELVKILRMLLREISLLDRRIALGAPTRIELSVELKELANAKRQAPISNQKLAQLLSIHDSQHNVIALAHAAIRLLSGEIGVLPKLHIFKMSPFEDCDMEGEIPSDKVIC